MTTIASTTCGQFTLIADMKIEGTERLVVGSATNSTNIMGLTINGMSTKLIIPDRGKFSAFILLLHM